MLVTLTQPLLNFENSEKMLMNMYVSPPAHYVFLLSVVWSHVVYRAK